MHTGYFAFFFPPSANKFNLQNSSKTTDGFRK